MLCGLVTQGITIRPPCPASVPARKSDYNVQNYVPISRLAERARVWRVQGQTGLFVGERKRVYLGTLSVASRAGTSLSGLTADLRTRTLAHRTGDKAALSAGCKCVGGGTCPG
ncbi:hypothetical protein J6590_022295 [Homalodisca vitripennis]|nr:hypothetical protein J6590_022295 [Homalodisca vitripennis]